MVENNGYLRRRILMISLLLTLSAGAALAQTTSFTYQGRLTDGGTPANGNYDLQFALFDSAQGVAQIGVTQIPNVAVSAGIFTVQLDFGATAFPGAPRFLEISARLAGTPTFTTLAPRQQITSTPYAIRSLNASTADAVIVNGVPGGSGNYIQNATTQQASANFNISGNGHAGGTLSASSSITSGGTLSGSIVNATTQYNIGGLRILGIGIPGTLFNTFLGLDAGSATTGLVGENAFFGNSAGALNTIGRSNSFFGYVTGKNNIEGSYNAFFGHEAGFNNTGSNNAFFGSLTGLSNHLGNDNTLMGFVAAVGFDNLTNATAIGSRAQVNQSNSLVLGSINGVNFATADTKVGIGTPAPSARLHVVGDTLLAGDLNVTGNITGSLPSGSANYIQNQTGSAQSAGFNINGNGTAAGTLSGSIVNATQYNIFGLRVLSTNGTNNILNPNNIFGGYAAGLANTTGTGNSFFGARAGAANTVGSYNSFFGSAAGEDNTGDPNNIQLGTSNSFFGVSTGAHNTTGSYNSFFGALAGADNTVGSENSFFGWLSGVANTGSRNAFFGNRAGEFNTSGSNNVVLGYRAGASNTTENSNTFIGDHANGAPGITNATSIGANASVTQSNALVLGNGVNVGIGTPGPLGRLDVRGDVLVGLTAVPVDGGLGFNSLFVANDSGDQKNSFRMDGFGNDLAIIAHSGTGSAAGTSISFRTAPAAALETDRVRIDANGNVGIGTTGPNAKLQVTSGDVYVQTQGRGIILRATDGANCYRVTVNNAGTLATTLVACP